MEHMPEHLQQEQMTIVIVGHVDHGKSTVIGRLFADTGSLPQGKLEQVKAQCARNARPFEYAFLLDALKDEQAQGITIDSARAFFKTDKRHYIIFDAPGHIEFLKNMVTGAAHAEAALLVIDAHEGIQENSKRHGYLLSMLGVKQISVLVNKMDLVDYRQEVFDQVVGDYTRFLSDLNIVPASFIPISARYGDLIVASSAHMRWFKGASVLEQLDQFTKAKNAREKVFRFPVQDVYRFTEEQDDRRIFAGTIESGCAQIGDEVVFLPSYKESEIKSIEYFNAPEKTYAYAEEAVGFTLATQVYVKPGEVMVKKSETRPQVSARFKANIFWMGKAPFIQNKIYKLKLATTRIGVRLAEVYNIIDASELQSLQNKEHVDRHDVAEVLLETTKPIAFDAACEIGHMGRFVIVDNYEIAGGGILLEKVSQDESLFERHIKERERVWEQGHITEADRYHAFNHKPKFIVLCGPEKVGKRAIAKMLEKKLFRDGRHVYYLGLSNVVCGLDADYVMPFVERDEHIRRLGELARIMTDAGEIFITTIHDIDDYDIKKLEMLNHPNELLVIACGESLFVRYEPALRVRAHEQPERAVEEICTLLKEKEILPLEYHI